MTTKTKSTPLILITNDDGYTAKGIHVLAEIAMKIGEVVVVSPEGPKSAQSHSITVKDPVRFYEKKLHSGYKTYACTGNPADCVKIGIHEILDRKPDLILSGVNHGSNLSASIFYSGTIAGAIEGCLNQIPSIAFSHEDHHQKPDYSAVEQYIPIIIEKFLANPLGVGYCLNVNFPSSRAEDIVGLKIARTADGYWKEKFLKRSDPFQHDYYWLTGEFINNEPQSIDTDIWAYDHNYVTVVPIHLDLTAHQLIESMRVTWEAKK